MQWFSTSGIFYIIENVILPLGSTILILFFLLFMVRLIKQDQVDIFDNAQFMSPKDARSYLKQVKKERIEKEFDTLLRYQKLQEGDKTEFVKLREDDIGIKDVLEKLNPMDEEDKK